MELITAFVFAYAKNRFSLDAVHFPFTYKDLLSLIKIYRHIGGDLFYSEVGDFIILVKSDH